MKTVLYVCVHNAGRSQMAEALTNHLAEQRGLSIRALSAGTVGGSQINPQARQVMQEIGISLDGHAPKLLTQAMVDQADRVMTMGCGVDADACPARIHLSEDWGLDDPKDQPIETVRRIRDQIQQRVEVLVDELALLQAQPPIAIACNLGALDAEQRQRYDWAVQKLRAALVRKDELADGWAFVFPSDTTICALATEFATLERLCCPFWRFHIEIAPQDGPLTLSLIGPTNTGAKELLAKFLER